MLTRRSRAREVALQLLFQADLNPAGMPRAAVERFARDRLNDDKELAGFALALFDGTIRTRAEIDPKLAAVAENWRLARMTPVDRNVLRLGSYELLFDPARPPVEVVLNEAIELARRFGGKDSPGFVNGILDKIAKSPRPAKVDTPAVPPPATVAPPEPAPTAPTLPSPAPVAVDPEPAPSPPTLVPVAADPKPTVPDWWYQKKHIVAYHNVEKMGHPIEPGGTFAQVTNKPVNHMVEGIVWLIQGEGENPRRYSLTCVYEVDEAGKVDDPDFENYIEGLNGHDFTPHLPLNDLPWFDDLFRVMNKFSVCPQTLKDERLIRALTRLAIRRGELRFEAT